MAELKSQMDADLQPDVDDIMSAMNFRLEQRRYLGTCSALGKRNLGKCNLDMFNLRSL